jgi:hypothetical protein
MNIELAKLLEYLPKVRLTYSDKIEHITRSLQQWVRIWSPHAHSYYNRLLAAPTVCFAH